MATNRVRESPRSSSPPNTRTRRVLPRSLSLTERRSAACLVRNPALRLNQLLLDHPDTRTRAPQVLTHCCVRPRRGSDGRCRPDDRLGREAALRSVFASVSRRTKRGSCPCGTARPSGSHRPLAHQRRSWGPPGVHLSAQVRVSPLWLAPSELVSLQALRRRQPPADPALHTAVHDS